MRSRTAGFLLVALALVPHTTTLAQAPASVAVGDRVRITTPHHRGRHRLVGRLAEVQQDSLVVETDDRGTRVRVPLAQAARVDVSRGRHTNIWRGMGIGMVGGAVTGAVIGATTYHKGRGPVCSPNDILFCGDWTGDMGEPDRGFSPKSGTITFGLLGILAGGIGGAIIRTERWSSRPLGGTARLRATPSGDPVVHVAIAF